MAENRVTAEMLEAGIQRPNAPGDARVTAGMIEVALLSGVSPGPGRAYLTAEMLEVGVWTGTLASALRSRVFLLE